MLSFLLNVEQCNEQAADEEERVHREGGIPNDLVPERTLSDDALELDERRKDEIYEYIIFRDIPILYLVLANGKHLQVRVHHHGPQHGEDTQAMQTGSV